MFCLGGFCPGGFWQGGFLSRGFLSGGLCPGGFCPGGFVLEPWKSLAAPQISLTFPVVFSCLHHHSKLKENVHRVSHYKTQQQTFYEPYSNYATVLACLKKDYLQQRPFPIPCSRLFCRILRFSCSTFES